MSIELDPWEEIRAPAPAHTPEERGALYVDVAALLAEGLPEPPLPTICRRSDGVGLLYAAQISSIVGDPESGKTWLAICAASEVLASGGRVLHIDADHNGAAQNLSRYGLLGNTAAKLGDPNHFRLIDPTDAHHLSAAVTDAQGWLPDLVVVDSVGEVLPLYGADSNSADDYTRVHRSVFVPFAVRGAAVLLIDHPAKGEESRRRGASGTYAKLRTIGGVALRVTLRDPFAPGATGSAVVSVMKDRPGGLRARSEGRGGEAAAAVLVLTSTSESVVWRLDNPKESDAVTASQIAGHGVTEKDIEAVAALPPEQQTTRGVKAALGVGSAKAGALVKAAKDRSSLPGPLDGNEEQERPQRSGSAPRAEEQDVLTLMQVELGAEIINEMESTAWTA